MEGDNTRVYVPLYTAPGIYVCMHPHLDVGMFLLFGCFFLTVLQGMWDLSSQTRD